MRDGSVVFSQTGHGRGLRDPRSHVVGHYLRGGTRDPADRRSHLVGGAVMEQSTHQRRVRPARQQNGHLGAWMVVDLPHYQLLCHATEVTIRALEQPQRNLVLEMLPALLQS